MIGLLSVNPYPTIIFNPIMSKNNSIDIGNKLPPEVSTFSLPPKVARILDHANISESLNKGYNAMANKKHISLFTGLVYVLEMTLFCAVLRQLLNSRLMAVNALISFCFICFSLRTCVFTPL
jgi:hypothetical protein